MRTEQIDHRSDDARAVEADLGRQRAIGTAAEALLAADPTETRRLLADLAADDPEVTAAVRATKTRPLPAADLRRLAETGRVARNQLIERHIGLAHWIACKAAPATATGHGTVADADDRIGEALLALTQAAQRWDYRHGAPFSSYASACIRGAVLSTRTANPDTPLHLPHSKVNLWRTARAAQATLAAEGDHSDAPAVAARLGITTALAAALLAVPVNARVIPLHEAAPRRTRRDAHEDRHADDVAVTVADLATDPDQASPEAQAVLTATINDLHQALFTLTEREEGILALRWGLANGAPHSAEEVAAVYGVTASRIHQIAAGAWARFGAVMSELGYTVTIPQDTKEAAAHLAASLRLAA